jgi:Tol biopolymer transport system component/tRNA A-37 threonylcarbamoyl transferase component Bud32
MSIAPGTRLGSYEVVSILGVGGMGEVYRARDRKLNRDVAIKVLLAAVAYDPERLVRFSREAQVLASLNHPYIAQIYGLEDSGDLHALVMELVEGPTLADRIAQGAIPADEAFAIAKQIAEALEAAHEQGIVHRDLKPANVKVRPDGTVKVLDFGLAKTLDSPTATAAAARANSPTITSPAMTQQGVILGTAAYMSPEQARGLPLDKRSDLWAFGCVLYEMLTARPPFTGGTVSDVNAAILSREPDWMTLPQATPAAIRKLLRRCLEKDRRQRLADAADARLELEETLASPEPETVAHTQTVSRRAGLVAVAVALPSVALITALIVWAVMRPAPQAPMVPTRFTIVPPPAQALVASGTARDLALSRDGTSLIYVGGRGQLIVRTLDRLDALPVPGVTNARAPFPSPDGRWVGFFTGVSGELRKVSLTGEPPISVCRIVGVARGASWSQDDTIVFATNEPTTGLLRVHAGGGQPEVLTTPDLTKGAEEDHLFPSVLPGSQSVLFTIAPVAARWGAGRLSGSGANVRVEVLDLKTGQRRTLLRGASQAEYVDTGHLIYNAAGTLRAVRFDLARLEVLGDPVAVLGQVMTAGSGAANFSVARNGTLAYVPAGAGSQMSGTRSLVWVTRQGREERIVAPLRNYVYPSLSPDGTRAALAIDDEELDIWSWDFTRQALTRVTFDPAREWYPGWTPDGRRIVFVSARGGVFNLYRRHADGTGSDERLTTSPHVQFGTPSFPPDGTRVVFTEVIPNTGEDLMMLSLDGAPKTEPLLQTPFAERNPQISPDGHWLAYESNESGQEEIYVRPFPKVVDGLWQISVGGGNVPLWARSGRELFYRNGDSVMSVAVQTTPTFSAGTPTKLFQGYVSGLGRTYDVSRDGQRFLMIKDPSSRDQTSAASIVIVLNWHEELKRLVPVR